MSFESQATIVPVVLCGGASRRLWPLTIPKPFLHLNGEYSLIQQTVRRLAPLSGLASPVFSCNHAYEGPLRAQMATLGMTEKDYHYIAEPSPRNTAPAFLMAGLEVQKRYGNNAIVMFLPSDHVIDDDVAYCQALSGAVELAKEGFLATIGLTPLSPHTGFGYIRRGALFESPEGQSCGYRIAGFYEKPALEEAQAYLESQQFYWNSGIYVLRVDVLFEHARLYCPELLAQVEKAFNASQTTENDLWVDAETYGQCFDAPFDKVISEKTQRGAVTEANFSWQDLGSWSTLASVADVNDKDAFGNVISGNIVTQGVRDCYIHTSSEKPVIALGIQDLVLVDTPEGLLITRKDMDQDVKQLISRLRPQSPGS